MVYKVNKVFLKIASSYNLILINVFIILILFLYGEYAYSKVTQVEINLALKYCDSIEKNMFKGLENERILKYEYFFNSINKEEINEEEINEEERILSNITSKVETICSYKLNNEDKEDFRKFLREFYLTIKK